MVGHESDTGTIHPGFNIMRVTLAMLLGALSASSVASAQETTITVRVIANDAKIIGSGVGGARVGIRNASTGQLLAEGLHEGSTGNTDRIMVAARERGSTVFDVPGAAVFIARVAIDTPTVVDVVAEGPLGYEHASQRAVKRLLLVPGEHVTGDGLILELHGFIVELEEPLTARRGTEVPVRVRIRMMCGCPHTPGGLWDADRLTVTARVYSEGRLVRESALRYAGEPNLFAGSISLEGVPDRARLVVLAADAERVNFGKSQAVELR